MQSRSLMRVADPVAGAVADASLMPPADASQVQSLMCVADPVPNTPLALERL